MRALVYTMPIDETAEFFKVLSGPTRLRILALLAERGKTGACVNEIAEATGASQSAASHQLARLEDRGFVVSFREGKTMCYMLSGSEQAKRFNSIFKITSTSFT